MDLSMIDNPDKSAEDSAQWARKWTTEKYQAKRRANFETVDAYLDQPVGRLLDIGCGFGYSTLAFALLAD
jgi:2-polyprenyl-3-methyl-5-hydroxy-6-metoxy-1,4-benzoquinol methylase